MSGLFGLIASAVGGLASSVFGGPIGKVIANGVGSVGKFISGAATAGASALGLIGNRATEAQQLWGTGKSLLNSTRNVIGAAQGGTLTQDSLRTYVGEVENAASTGRQMYQRTRQDAARLNELYQGVRADYRNVCNVGSGEVTRPDLYAGYRNVYNPTYSGPQRMAPGTYNPYVR